MILRGLADQALAAGGKCNVGRSDSIALVVGDNFDLAVFEDADEGIAIKCYSKKLAVRQFVRGAQVDADGGVWALKRGGADCPDE